MRLPDTSNGIDMRLTILKSGTIRTWRHLLAGDTEKPERIDVPVPFFVIEHDNKLILFDAGQQKPSAPADENANYITLMNDEDTLSNQLKLYGFCAQNVTHVIISHAHGDHFGGLAELGDVECFIQQKEIETSSGAYILELYQDKKWHLLDGKTDIFNDGRIIAVPTPGHTAGHQSLLLTLDDGSQVCLAADALYMDCALDDDNEIRSTSFEAISCFRKMREANVRIISGHDPFSFEDNQKFFNNMYKGE